MGKVDELNSLEFGSPPLHFTVCLKRLSENPHCCSLVMFNVSGVHSLLVNSANWEFFLSHLYSRQVLLVGKLQTDIQVPGRERTGECYFEATSLVQIVPGHQNSPSSGEV